MINGRLRAKQRRSPALALHEAGHAVAYTAFSVPVKMIEMDYCDESGCVIVGAAENRLCKRDRIVASLAGLAGERFHYKHPGVVETIRRRSPNSCEVSCPESIGGEDGDLSHIEQMIPRAMAFTDEPRRQYLNVCLLDAWKLLRRNKKTFITLAEYLAPVKELDESFEEYHFASEYRHILKQVKPE